MEEKRPQNAMSERTPLLQRVPVEEEPRRRYPHNHVRRFCTTALVAIPLITTVIALSYINIAGHKSSQCVHARGAWSESTGISYQELKAILGETPSPNRAREWSQYYTAGAHLAGKNLSQAEWTRDKWAEFGIDSAEVVAYDVYINYPVDHSLSLLDSGKIIYKATLEEDVLDEDPTTSLDDRIPTFHGYSASGNVTAQFVYVNYGTYDDYENLLEAGINLQGKIALARYGGIFRGLKVKRASELGMLGVVIYSDPGDDGEVTEFNGYQTYPNGPARNPSSVQRGSVSYLSVAPGDPTTIGYPSKPGAPRQSVEGKIPDIPSLPISYADALPILTALNGHGPNASSFPTSWQSGGLRYKGVQYNIGPSPVNVTLNLYNEQEYVTNPLWNTIGIINGTHSDEVVVIGNHRDAWIAGGAGDPNSGSASLNEVVRSFGKALAAGWRPRRTIIFASWDGEEYSLIGSTEWVEEYLPWLSESAVAYINVDVGTRGPVFQTSAAPLLNKAIYEVTAEVQSPNQTIPGQTVRDIWDGHISTMGSGSDFTAFQDFAGIPSIDLGFGSGPKNPVYHYHSNYDSFYWMDKFGDPGFEYHATIARIINLLAAKLAEEPIIQLNATDYALGLETYLDSIKQIAADIDTDIHNFTSCLRGVEHAIANFKRSAIEFEGKVESVMGDIDGATTLSSKLQLAIYGFVKEINSKLKFLERRFVFADGLDGRSWFKHVVFAPGLWTGYAGATFPGLVEALDAKNATSVRRWSEIIADTIWDAANSLDEDLAAQSIDALCEPKAGWWRS